MKRIVCFVFAMSIISVFAQPSPLLLSTDKTISLIFPFSIKHVDRGTKDILAQPVKETENILLVKAASKGFADTNLSVITDDGSIYSFAVSYGDPSEYVYRLPVQAKGAISTYANSILDNPKTLTGGRDSKWEMTATVAGIYIKDDVIFYQIEFDNLSPVDYDVEYLRFYIRDKKKTKRTAIQENELTPLYIAGNTSHIKGHSRSVIVVALQRFTIPDGKFFAIQMGEKNGGRHLLIKVGNQQIIKAILLPDVK